MDRPYNYEGILAPASIRLLKITYLKPSDCPVIQLITVSLNDPTRPPYTCLSYTWGSPVPGASYIDRDTFIDITRPDGNVRRFDITPSLHDFLQHLHTRSHAGVVTYLWVDAVCVNQADLDERANQVTLMGRIYSDCEKTIVWLGPADSNSHAAVQLIKYYEGVTPSYEDRVPPEGMHTNDLYMIFGTFLDRTWFHRTWTLQELVLPPQVVFWCGAMDFSPKQLYDAVWSLPMSEAGYFSLAGHDKLDPITFGPTRGSRRVAESHHERKNTLKYVATGQWHGIPASAVANYSRVRECFDQRDRIYGIMGISNVSIPITVDYEKSAVQIFTEFVLATANVCAFVPARVEHRNKRKTIGLPSWVPDFAVPLAPSSWTTLGANKIYSAGGGEGTKPLASSDPVILAVNGMMADSVKHIAGNFGDISSGKFLVDCLAVLDTLPQPGVDDNAIGSPGIVEMFWRTLVVNNYQGKTPEAEIFGPSFSIFVRFHLAKWLFHLGSNKQEARKLQDNLKSLKRKGTPPAYLPTWGEVETTAARFDTAVDLGDVLDAEALASLDVYVGRLRAMFVDRCFFVTNDFRMGIGPDCLELGTHICLVEGCQYPWLLEEAGTGGRYRLAGVGYVQGIMHGELYTQSALRRIEIE